MTNLKDTDLEIHYADHHIDFSAIKSIRDLVKKCFPVREWPLDQYRFMISSGGVDLLVRDSEKKDKLVGVVLSIPYFKMDAGPLGVFVNGAEPRATLFNTTLALDPSYQGQGIGNFMIDEWLEESQLKDYRTIIAPCREGANTQLYLNRGARKLMDLNNYELSGETFNLCRLDLVSS